MRGRPAGLFRQLLEANPGEMAALIRTVLNETKGNRSEAADILGISRSAFYKVIRELGMADDLMPTRHTTKRPSRAAVVLMLNHARGNRQEAARLYGVSVGTIRRWLADYKLNIPYADDPYWKVPE